MADEFLEILIPEHLVVDAVRSELLEVSVQGPPGPRGLQGPAGSGSGGTGGDLSYIHAQSVPEATWVVTHNLGKFPSVTVVDSAGSVVIGDITYTDNTALTIYFSSGFAGTAYLN